MSNYLKIECGPADGEGRRVVLARCGGDEHRDRFNTDDAFRRQKFAIALLTKFNWPISPDQLAEIDTKLVGEADAEDSRPAAKDEAQRVCLADVAPVEVGWLWPGRIALGKVTLLAGDPGLGKSMVTLDIAARVSRGAGWPDECSSLAPREESLLAEREAYTPASVVLLSAEDDLADTIRPRLEAHHADCSRIVAIQAIGSDLHTSGARRTFDLGRDLEHLVATIDSLDNCRLVIIDPISAYLGRTGENANAEVRSLLSPLAQLAAERQLAVLVVTHLRKEEGAAMYRTMGSLAFIAAARGAWIICKDPMNSGRRFFLPVKNNLGTDVGGLAYTVEPCGADGRAAVCWSAKPVTCDVNTAMREMPRRTGPKATERNEVVEWLKAQLATGARPAAELREVALGHGFSVGTLRRAFRELGGTAQRDDAGQWHWSLVPSSVQVPGALQPEQYTNETGAVA